MNQTAAPEDVESERLRLELRLRLLEAQEASRSNFLSFMRYAWPEAIIGEHHRRIADVFDRVANGTCKRVIINLPPRHSKSEMASYLLPAFIMGKKPKTKIIQATHTGELAVRFGRKVRDLMITDTYRQLFPDVFLKADSKAAGRWDTSDGGEYFACLRRYALVSTKRGVILAGQVVVGDELLNASGWVKVHEIFNSEHNATATIAGLECSLDHPIWTLNRGWVFAGQVAPTDILYTESILDRMKASLGRLYGYLEHAHVPSLVQHQVPLHQPQERKVAKLWWARDYVVRALAGIRELLSRHGTPAFVPAYSWADRQQWSVQSGKLPVGNAYSAGQQQENQCPAGKQDIGGKRQGVEHHATSDSLSDENRSRSFVPTQAQNEELRSYGDPENIGWVRRRAVSIFVQCFQAVSKFENSPKVYLARVAWAAKKLSGLFLGVRAAGEIRIKHHGPRPFVNFLTDGDHTFFADGVLTHNCGVGGALTGRGADLLIIDDPHSEQDSLSELALDNAWEWYQSGPRTRLQPGGSVILVMTRWGTRDLAARLLKAQISHKADRWEVIEFPAILPSGNPLWPEYWKLEELLSVKASLSPQKWNAMYQQQPTNDEGAILKREWWQLWEHDYTPKIDYIIQSYDTAYSKKETADFSVITTWGVFYPQEDGGPAIILLDMQKGRWDFPELKRRAKEQYDEWKPDNVLIEAKATGVPLQQELRRIGIPVTMYTPGGRRSGQDKISRANAVAPLFESGMVWAPDTDWAMELIEECAAFPNGDNDDLVDSTTQAMMRFRAGNFINLDSDYQDEKTSEGLVPEYY